MTFLRASFRLKIYLKSLFKRSFALQYRVLSYLEESPLQRTTFTMLKLLSKMPFPFSTVNTHWLYAQLTTAERTGTIVGTWLSPSISSMDNSMGKQELSQNNFRSKY